MDFLFEQFAFKLRSVDCSLKRFLYYSIDWSRNPVIIKGARGVGKSYLALQYVKLNCKFNQEVLLISAEHIYFSQNTLLEFAEKFVKKGGKQLFIDDIHKYKAWQTEIKQVLNKFDKLQIVLIGHALEEYTNSDFLPPNLAEYELPGLSLREYISFSAGVALPAISLDEIINNHSAFADEITATIDPTAYTDAYLRYGYYPFFIKNRNNYIDFILNNTISFLESDLTFSKAVDYKNLTKIKQLLWNVASKGDAKPNITEISELVGTTRGTLLQYLDYLAKGGILCLLKKSNTDDSIMTKPDRILLSNPNLAAVLVQGNTKKRILNKTFLLAQFSLFHSLSFSEHADFETENYHIQSVVQDSLIQIQTQKHNCKKLYAVDSLEIGVNNHIPLWIFGFMY